MNPIAQLKTGPFNFLGRGPEELRRVMPDADRILPAPLRIYLEDENATPAPGFPILPPPSSRPSSAFDNYLVQEEAVEYATIQHTSFDSSAFGGAWEHYRLLLTRATENVITANTAGLPGGLLAASLGRHRPRLQGDDQADVASRSRLGAPVRRRVPLSRLPQGDGLVSNLVYDQVNRPSSDTEELEEQLFPACSRG
ncbi:MAG: hypothetical protein R2862_07055 [Thermoanaerobaculia bacterium]